MIYRYEIKNSGTEDVLYLYATMTYEFSKEFNEKEEQLENRCKTFIKNNSVQFHGEKVCLVVDGIIVKTMNIDENKEKKLVKNKSDFSNENFNVTVLFANNEKINISLKDYLLGVIATNALQNLELTTLKALCLLYRTYAYKEMKEHKYVNAVNQYQIYKPISYYKVFWLDKYQENYNIIAKAIEDTDGEFVTYNDEYIYPFIHICNNGFTRKSSQYEYLDRKSSLWDYASSYYIEINDFKYESLEKIFKKDKDAIKNIKIREINDSNQIEKIQIDDKIYSGEYFKSLLNLKSSDITIIVNPTFIRFITKGWGNQYGLSQFGANEIAKNGCSYTSIINYYFTNVSIKKYK